MSAYATGSDLVARYDADMVRDLATDREDVTSAEIASNARVLVALEDASGEVDVALLAGGRYTVDQLQTLTGNSRSHLKSIVCSLAIVALHSRRPESAEKDFIDQLSERAREAIRALKRGENIFGLDEIVDATAPEATGPTAIQIQNRNALPDRMARYFPTADTRLPRGR